MFLFRFSQRILKICETLWATLSSLIMPRSCLSPAPLFCPHSNPVQLQVLPSSPLVLCSLHSLLGTWTHLLTCCLAACPASYAASHAEKAFLLLCPLSLTQFPSVHVCCMSVCVCGVLCVTFNDFRVQIVQNLRWARIFTPATRGVFSEGPYWGLLFSGVPHLEAANSHRACCHWHSLPLIEAQSGATRAAQTLCAIAWRAFNSIGHQWK